MRNRRLSICIGTVKWLGLAVCLAIVGLWGLAIRDVLKQSGSGGMIGDLRMVAVVLLSAWYMFFLVVFAILTAMFWIDCPAPMEDHCYRCGYNLTANESGVCPECGTKIEESKPRRHLRMART